MPNWAWVLVLVVMLAAFTFTVARFNRPVLFIVVLHNIIWATALILIGTGLIQYVESSSLAWLTLAAGLMSFNLGAYLSRYSLGGDRSTGTVLERSKSTLPLVTRWMLVILTAIYASAFAYFLITIQVRFGIASLVTDPVLIRSSRNPSYLEAVPLPIRLLLYLGPLLFAIYGLRSAVDRPLPVWVRTIALLLLSGSMLAMLQRTNLFMALLLLLALFLTRTTTPLTSDDSKNSPAARLLSTRGPSGKAVKIVAVVLVGLLAFGAFQLVGGALRKSGSAANATGAVSPVLANTGLTEPFIYFTAGSVAFLQLVDSQNFDWPPEAVKGELLLGDYNPQTWGSRTFSPVVKLIPGAKTLPGSSAFVETPVLTNVFTWFEDAYRDFRIYGVVLGGLLTGFVVAALYARRGQSSRAYWLQAALVSVIFLATFVPKFTDTLLLTVVAAILIISSPLLRRRTKHRSGVPELRSGVGESVDSG